MSVGGRGATTENDIIKGVMTTTTLDDIILCITTTRYCPVFNSNVFSAYTIILIVFSKIKTTLTPYSSQLVCVYIYACSYIIRPQHDVLLFMKNDTFLYEDDSRWERLRRPRWFFNRFPTTRQLLGLSTNFITLWRVGIIYYCIYYCVGTKIFPQKIKVPLSCVYIRLKEKFKTIIIFQGKRNKFWLNV